MKRGASLREFELSYQKEHSSKGRKSSKKKERKLESIPNKDKSYETYLEEEDFQMMDKIRLRGEHALKAHLNVTKTELKRNVDSLKSRLTKVENHDSRSSGVGLVGGHIARELRCPSPLNGHRKISEQDQLIVPANMNFTGMTTPKLHSDTPLTQPVWDSNFTRHHFTTYEKRPNSAPDEVSRSEAFRQEVFKLRSSSNMTNIKGDKVLFSTSLNLENYKFNEKDELLLSNRTKLAPLSPPTSSYLAIAEENKRSMSAGGGSGGRGDHSEYGMGVSTFRGSTNVINTAIMENEEDYQSASSSDNDNDLPTDESLFDQRAIDLWKQLTNELVASAQDIDHHDLNDINVLRSPPEPVVDVFSYICLLLGLQPTWNNTRASLLHETNVLIKFFNEVSVIILHVYLSVNHICLSIHASIYLNLCIYLSICHAIHLCISPSIYPCNHPSISYPSMHPSIYLNPFIYLSQSIHLSLLYNMYTIRRSIHLVFHIEESVKLLI